MSDYTALALPRTAEEAEEWDRRNTGSSFDRRMAWMAAGKSEQEARKLVSEGVPPPPKKTNNAIEEAPKESNHHEEQAKPKKLRPDRADNERKMRDAILRDVQRNHWNRQGIRKLARQAGGMKHRTARETLDRMEQDGQIVIDRKWGQGRPHGVKVLARHPAWSGHKHAQLAPVLAGQTPNTHRQLTNKSLSRVTELPQRDGRF